MKYQTVKCSDRLPEDKIEYFVIDKDGDMFTDIWSGNSWHHEHPPLVEIESWLEPIADTQDTKKADSDKGAEELAFKKYPINMGSIGDESEWDMNEQYRDCWIEGYNQFPASKPDKEWVSVKDGMPEKDTSTYKGKYSGDKLVYNGDIITVVFCDPDNKLWFDTLFEDELELTTHWRELPTPPKDK